MIFIGKLLKCNALLWAGILILLPWMVGCEFKADVDAPVDLTTDQKDDPGSSADQSEEETSDVSDESTEVSGDHDKHGDGSSDEGTPVDTGGEKIILPYPPFLPGVPWTVTQADEHGYPAIDWSAGYLIDDNMCIATPCSGKFLALNYEDEYGGGFGYNGQMLCDDGGVVRLAHCNQMMVNLYEPMDAGTCFCLNGSTGRSSGSHCHEQCQQGVGTSAIPFTLEGYSKITTNMQVYSWNDGMLDDVEAKVKAELGPDAIGESEHPTEPWKDMREFFPHDPDDLRNVFCRKSYGGELRDFMVCYDALNGARVGFAIFGRMRDQWEALNGPRGIIGTPITNEYSMGNMTCQDGTKAIMGYNPNTGATKVVDYKENVAPGMCDETVPDCIDGWSRRHSYLNIAPYQEGLRPLFGEPGSGIIAGADARMFMRNDIVAQVFRGGAAAIFNHFGDYLLIARDTLGRNDWTPDTKEFLPAYPIIGDIAAYYVSRNGFENFLGPVELAHEVWSDYPQIIAQKFGRAILFSDEYTYKVVQYFYSDYSGVTKNDVLEAFGYCTSDCDNGDGDNEDDDDDGVTNDSDNCNQISNPNQRDCDNDGYGDACDPEGDRDNDGSGECDRVSDPDEDGDNVDDNYDNCPNASNADQRDCDDDGYGNACDPEGNIDSNQNGICDNDEPDTSGPAYTQCHQVNVSVSENSTMEPGKCYFKGDADDFSSPASIFGVGAFSCTFPYDGNMYVQSYWTDPNGMRRPRLLGAVSTGCDGLGGTYFQVMKVDDFSKNCSQSMVGQHKVEWMVCEHDGADCGTVASVSFTIDSICETQVSDADKDGVPDDVDNCPNNVNGNQADSDEDGYGNACDSCSLDPNNDADNDDVCGNADNCPDVANAPQTNSDSDGFGDACDMCKFDTDNDIDHDGICGDVDNCANAGNADQSDCDGDKVGNVCDSDDDNDGAADGNDCAPCDPNRFLGNTEICGNNVDEDCDGKAQACDNDPPDDTTDTDGDGKANSKDNCPNLYNPNQKDFDLDKVGDDCDNCRYTANADQGDGDRDGLGDVCDLNMKVELENSTCDPNGKSFAYHWFTNSSAYLELSGSSSQPLITDPGNEIYICGVNYKYSGFGIKFNRITGSGNCENWPVNYAYSENDVWALDTLVVWVDRLTAPLPQNSSGQRIREQVHMNCTTDPDELGNVNLWCRPKDLHCFEAKSY